MILLDTNVLTRLANRGHSEHVLATTAVERLNDAGGQPVIVPQVLYEFWVVATRPGIVNGLDLSATEARSILHEIRSAFALVPENAAVLTAWESILREYDIVGK